MISPLKVKIDDTWTENVPAVIPLDKLHDVIGTVLDPEIQKNGTRIKLPFYVNDSFGRKIYTLKLPPIQQVETEGIVLLHPLTLMFNNVARLAKLTLSGETKVTHLAKSVRRYQQQAMKLLAGKNGLINRVCVASRTRNSLRAVTLPSVSHGPEWIGVPHKVMHAQGHKHGDLIMAVRFPAIWDGSVEVFRARGTQHDCIEVHPLLHQQFGLDHDGDTMSLYWIPDDPECQAEAEDMVIHFLKVEANPQWPKALRMNDKPNTPINMNDLEKIQKKTLDRLPCDGFSISPRDILQGMSSNSIQTYENVFRKDMAEDNEKIARGLDLDNYLNRVMSINTLNAMMKTQMGPIGSMANKIKLLAIGVNSKIQRSGMDLSEEIQQTLLSCKHVVGSIHKQRFSQILDIMNRRDERLKKAYPQAILAALAELDVNVEKAAPFITYAFWAYPCILAMKRAEERMTDKQQEEVVSALMATTELPIDQIDQACIRAFGLLVRHAAGDEDLEHWQRLLSKVFWWYSVGINEIIRRGFPVFRFVTQQIQNDLSLTELTEMVLINGQEDEKGFVNDTLRVSKGREYDNDGTSSKQETLSLWNESDCDKDRIEI